MLSRLLRPQLVRNAYAYGAKRPFASTHQTAVTEDKNDATSKFFESVTSTLKGITHVNYIVEHDPNLSEADKKGKKRFLIYRYDPSDENDTPKYVSYYVPLEQISPMYLDALLYVKNVLDPTLAFRRSCREGICGSCSMNCDGLHSLACIKPIDRDLSKPSVITPLGHMFVLRDLVVDMTNFYTQYKSIDPYLKRKTPKEDPKLEYYQSPEDRKKLDGMYECVLCACCSTSCPSYWWHPDRYLGPAVLMQSLRWIVDSRDEYTEERIEKLTEDIKLEDCQNIGMCSVTCPKGLDPRAALQELLRLAKEYKDEKIHAEAL
jgi:succinate dehydrogenase (ubiquinone) iron-sulfur subunit